MMKIQVGKHIPEKSIRVNTKDEFQATYKGCEISITTDHGFGKPKYDHLKRFNMDVNAPDGCYLCQTWEDHHSIKDAIRSALKGAGLI